ncbi:MAG: hypothetical protein ACJA02_000220 [Myxococcota bacterium]|jgi:hypothetical protein
MRTLPSSLHKAGIISSTLAQKTSQYPVALRRNLSGGSSNEGFKDGRIKDIFTYFGVAGTVLGTSYYAIKNAGMVNEALQATFPPDPPKNNRKFDGKDYTRHLSAPKKTDLQSSRLINTFGINLSDGNNKSHFALIHGDKNSGKSYLADSIVNHNTSEAEKHGIQVTNLRVRCHTKKQYCDDLLKNAKLLKCLPEKTPESDQEYLTLANDIANQCKLRGGVVNLTFICVRSKFDEDGKLDIPLFYSFYPPFQSSLFCNSDLPGHGKIMDNVNLVFTSGEKGATDYLEKLKMQSFNSCSDDPDDIKFLRNDFYQIVENEKFTILKAKLTLDLVPTDLIDSLMKHLKGNSLLLEMATNYLNHPRSEPFVDFLIDLNSQTKGREIGEVLLEKNLDLIKTEVTRLFGLDDKIVNNVFHCLYSQPCDPQDRTSKEQSRMKFSLFLNESLPENVDFKSHVDAYNFALQEAEKLLLVRPNRDGKSWLVVGPDLMDKLMPRTPSVVPTKPSLAKALEQTHVGAKM